MSGFFTWGRIAAIAGVGVAAAGVAYLVKTERGRALVQQVREKGQEVLAKARQSTNDALQSPQAALSATDPVPEEQPAT